MSKVLPVESMVKERERALQFLERREREISKSRERERSRSRDREHDRDPSREREREVERERRRGRTRSQPLIPSTVTELMGLYMPSPDDSREREEYFAKGRRGSVDTIATSTSIGGKSRPSTPPPVGSMPKYIWGMGAGGGAGAGYVFLHAILFF